MKRLIAVLALTIGVLALSAAPSLAAKGGTDRPFKSRGSETGVVKPDGTFDLQGPSRESHLGKSWSETKASFNSPASTVTITAANGDQLYGAFVKEIPVTVTCPPLASFPIFFAFAGESQWTGGTGRFTNATGTTDGQGCFYFDPSTGTIFVTFTSTGTISY
jgi:hypothetical protein